MVIAKEDIDFLHEDATVFNTRKKDILSEFKKGEALRYKLQYDDEKTIPDCAKEARDCEDYIGYEITRS